MECLKLAFCLLLLLSGLELPAEEILVKSSPPFSMKRDDGTWTGVSVELWELASAKAGIQGEYRETDLEGLLKGVASSEALAGISALSITADREKRLDFTLPYYTANMGFAVAPTENSLWMAVSPFFSQVFFRILGALFVVIFIFGFLLWVFERKDNPRQFGGSSIEGLGSAFWWSAVTMSTVGYGDKVPVTPLGRLVGLVWMFVALITVSSFTATITSSLTVNQINQGVNSLSDLQGKSLGVIPGSTAESYIRARGFKTVPVKDIETALSMVANGELSAMVHDLPVLSYGNRRAGWGLRVVPILEAPVQRFAFALPPGSPHREALNVAMLEVMDDRLWEAILREHLADQH